MNYVNIYIKEILDIQEILKAMKMNIVVQYIPIYKNYYKIYQMARKNINTVIEDSTHVPTLYVDKWVLNILLSSLIF